MQLSDFLDLANKTPLGKGSSGAAYLVYTKEPQPRQFVIKEMPIQSIEQANQVMAEVSQFRFFFYMCYLIIY